MKQYSKLFSLVLLGSTAAALASCCSNNNNSGSNNCVIPFIQWRSQGRNMARKLEGTTSYAVYQGDMDNTYGTFNIAVEYDQTFRGHQIAQCLFGDTLIDLPNTNNNNNCSNSCDNNRGIVISGLNANGLGTGRAATELMAENFLLPRDFKSTISFSPKVQSVILDFDLFVGLDRWVNGLYFRLYGPVVWNKSKLEASENIITQGTAGYPQGYFDIITAVPASSLFQSALNFFGGCQLPKYANEAVTVQPLQFAKFSDCNLNNNMNNNNCSNSCNGTSHHKTGFAELRGEFGWNYIADKYRFLINIQAAAPTGTRPNAEFLLPAYVGNGRHWELGGGIGGSWMMWGSEDGERSFNFIVEADITHLFKANQKMTFDLKNKPLSRYMLAEQLGTPAADAALTTGTSTFAAPSVEAGVYMPVANFSTRDVKVGFGVQADLVAMFNYTHRGFSWDLGYNFWALSCSKISMPCNDNDCSNNNSCNANIINPFPTNMALKGDASVIGYNPSDGSVAIFGLGATESGATIFTGTNAVAANAASPVGNPLTNLGIDTATAALVPATPTNIPLFVFNANPAIETPIKTSTTPVFISINDLDVEGAKQRGLSNKVFTHFSYTWTDRDRWVPYFGGGFSAEFGDHCGGNDDCNPTTVTTVTTNNNNGSGCNSCKKCALTQWGVEIKGGVSFH